MISQPTNVEERGGQAGALRGVTVCRADFSIAAFWERLTLPKALLQMKGLAASNRRS